MHHVHIPLNNFYKFMRQIHVTSSNFFHHKYTINCCGTQVQLIFSDKFPSWKRYHKLFPYPSSINFLWRNILWRNSIKWKMAFVYAYVLDHFNWTRNLLVLKCMGSIATLFAHADVHTGTCVALAYFTSPWRQQWLHIYILEQVLFIVQCTSGRDLWVSGYFWWTSNAG